jgi:hypothetical protein
MTKSKSKSEFVAIVDGDIMNDTFTTEANALESAKEEAGNGLEDAEIKIYKLVKSGKLKTVFVAE